MKRYIKLVISATAIAAVTLFNACTSQSAYDNNTISFARLSTSETFTLCKSAEAYDTDSDLIFVDSVAMLIPTLIGNHNIQPLQDSIFKAAFDTTGVDHKAIINSYFKKEADEVGFTTTLNEKKSNAMQADGFEIINGTIVNLTPRLLVYCITNSSMQPRAAHGMTVKRYINYMTDEGLVLNLVDIFNREGIQKLPEIIAKRASEQASTFGPTEINALPAADNFYISANNEIVFAYQPYEVASYAQGFINISFFPYELVSYMTPLAVKFFGLSDLAE